MIRRIGVILVWVLATLVATTVALAAVRSVAGQVVDEPGSPLLSATSSLALSDTTTTSPATTTGAPTSTTVVPDDGLVVIPSGPDEDVTTTTAAPVTTTTAAPAETTPPATTTTTTTTTTTSSAPATETATYQLAGGWVRITSSPGVVTLAAAGPNSGYTMDVEHTGPAAVEVEFRKDEHRSTFKAEWDDGKLDVEIEEHEDGDDDD